jgi:hypothetical protein
MTFDTKTPSGAQMVEDAQLKRHLTELSLDPPKH